MKKAKIPQNRTIVMLKMLCYINTHYINQRETLDISARYLILIDYYMRLVAPNKGRPLGREDINLGPKIIPDENQTNECRFSYDKELVM